VTETLGPAVRIDTTALADEPAEVQRRVLQTVLRQIAPAPYDPRGPALQALRIRLLAGGQGTLAGCRFQRMTSGLWAYREAKAVQGLVAAPDAVWDGRWRIAGPAPAGAEVRALGPGLALCPDWRATGLPRGALLSSPALWLGDTLIAAPHAGFGMGYSAIPLFPAAALHQLP
jgi:tRNA(Ile)-lysidine synthase